MFIQSISLVWRRTRDVFLFYGKQLFYVAGNNRSILYLVLFYLSWISKLWNNLNMCSGRKVAEEQFSIPSEYLQVPFFFIISIAMEKMDFLTDRNSVSQTEGLRKALSDSRGWRGCKWNNSVPIFPKTLKEHPLPTHQRRRKSKIRYRQ